jgi:hypothetical protein
MYAFPFAEALSPLVETIPPNSLHVFQSKFAS